MLWVERKELLNGMQRNWVTSLTKPDNKAQHEKPLFSSDLRSGVSRLHCSPIKHQTLRQWEPMA